MCRHFNRLDVKNRLKCNFKRFCASLACYVVKQIAINCVFLSYMYFEYQSKYIIFVGNLHNVRLINKGAIVLELLKMRSNGIFAMQVVDIN